MRASGTLGALLLLGACASTASQPRHLNTDLSFAPVAPFQVEAEYVWHGGDDEYGFAASLATRDVTDCYDIVPASDAVEQVLRQIDDYPDVIYEPPPPPVVRFTLTIDAIAEVPTERASYIRWSRDEAPLLSSSPWYRMDGQQVFMSCTQDRSAFRVYRVSAVEQL